MPIYEYHCKTCDHQFSKLLKIDDRKTPENDPCPKCSNVSVLQAVFTAPGIADPVRIGVTKQDGNFKEVLQGIHANSPGSKLDTYF